jgi:uncharacterized protein (TIGR02145 family)
VRKIHLVLGCIIFIVLLPFVTYAQVTDIEGNTYKTVQIGTQLWMAENLKTTRYNNGSEIPLVTGPEWDTMSTDGYCWYNNNYKIFGKIYGALYNWYAVATGNLCPTGWRVPADADWVILCDYLGGEKSAGGMLKETGTLHWKSPNSGATNSTGFKALPGGGRWVIGRFDLISRRGYWWSSSTFDNNSDTTIRMIPFDESLFLRVSGLKGSGFSVRCIKD